MMIRAECPQCDRVLNVADHLAGKLVLCPDCKERIRIPKPEAEDDEAPRPVARRKANPDRSDSRVSPSRRPRPQDEDDEETPRSRTRRRPIEEEEDDEDERPRRRARSRYDDEDDERPRRRSRYDDDEDDDRPRKRSRHDDRPARRPKKAAASSLPFGMDLPSLIVMGTSVFALLLVVVSLLVPLVSLLVMLLGAAMAIVGGIWFIIVAFQDEVMHGLLCLFVPFYALYYLVTHLDTTKQPFFLQLIGTLCMWVGAARLAAMGG